MYMPKDVLDPSKLYPGAADQQNRKNIDKSQKVWK